MASLKYTLTASGTTIILGGSYIDAEPIKPGTHTSVITPTAMIDIAVNASVPPPGGSWTLKYWINGVDQTPGGPITEAPNNGTANHQSTRPLIP